MSTGYVQMLVYSAFGINGVPLLNIPSTCKRLHFQEPRPLSLSMFAPTSPYPVELTNLHCADPMFSEWDSTETAPDLLNRATLAAALARGLLRSRSHESLITALYGPWGSGKSWLKRHVLERLQAEPEKITIVEFAPWQIKGVDELTLQFFAQINEQLAPKGKQDSTVKLTKRQRLWSKLARLSGAGSAALKVFGGAALLNPDGDSLSASLLAAGGMGDSLSALLKAAADDTEDELKRGQPSNLEEVRKELTALFTDEDSPRLLVVIDDLDRLANDEIQALVRLIKANANFAGLNYLLLCDPDQLASALDPISSGKGREFLEKIVQNPVHLPMPDRGSLLRQLKEGLVVIAKRVHYPFDKHMQRLEFYFSGFLKYRLKNLRSVYRLLEALEFSGAVLTRDGTIEVDLIDLLAVDYLRLHAAPVVDWLRLNGISFETSISLRHQLTKDLKPRFSEEFPAGIMTTIDGRECYAVMRCLFPSLAKAFASDEQEFQSATRRVRHMLAAYPLAISSAEHFDSYFMLQPSPYKMPETDYQNLLSGAWERAELRCQFKAWIEHQMMSSALRRLRKEAETFTPHQKSALFLALGDCSDLIGQNQNSDEFDNELGGSMRIMEDLLTSATDPSMTEIIDKLFESCIGITARLWALGSLRIRQSPSDWPEIKPNAAFPVLRAERLEELRQTMSPVAAKGIIEDQYFDSFARELRVWSWVHALGHDYIEPFLNQLIDESRTHTVLSVIRAIARSLVGRYMQSFEVPTSFDDTSSKGLLESLLKLASAAFWQKFVDSVVEDYPPAPRPQNSEHCLVQHIRLALSTPEIDITNRSNEPALSPSFSEI